MKKVKNQTFPKLFRTLSLFGFIYLLTTQIQAMPNTEYGTDSLNLGSDDRILAAIPLYKGSRSKTGQNKNLNAIDFSELEKKGNSKSIFNGVANDTLTYYQIGQASWYGRRFQGKKTASGQSFDIHKLTAAHRTLPFGSRILVRNLGNGKEVTVTINDRGPYIQTRILDLSFAAARQLGFLEKGTAKVGIIVIEEFSTARNNPQNGAKNKATRLNLMDRDNLSVQRPETFSSKSQNDTYDPFSKWEEEGKPVFQAPNKGAVFLEEEKNDIYSRRNQNNFPKGSDSYYFENQKRERNSRSLNRGKNRTMPKAGSISIQVGSFKVMDNARRLKSNLEGKYNHPVFIHKSNNWYKVWLGEFSSRNQAKSFQKRLISTGLRTILHKN